MIITTIGIMDKKKSSKMNNNKTISVIIAILVAPLICKVFLNNMDDNDVDHTEH